jgi:biotin transport system substrate-specific component
LVLLSDGIRLSTRRRIHGLAYDLALVLGGSILVALSSQLAVRLPFSPVPVTGQTLAVLCVGLLLGSRRAALSLLLYLAEGAIGLPVFAGGGSGLPWLLGPTGGYLWGFVLGAFLVGHLTEHGWDRHIALTLLALMLGNAVVYAAGLSWLARVTGTDRVLEMGLYPFLAGDAIKIAVAAGLLRSGRRFIGLSSQR